MSSPVPASLPFRDRRRALVVYGWMLVVVGGVCALLGLFLVAAMVMAAGVPGATVMPGATAFNAILYAGMAAVFVALGVGSIRAKRWARTLIVIVSWVWLAVGSLSLVAAAVLLPRAFNSMPSAAPPGTVTCMVAALVLIFGLFFVALPLVFLLFYKREDVRRTVEAAGPPDWSERVSPNLLGMVLFLLFGAVTGLLSLVVVRAVPVFGKILTGWDAVLLVVVFCVLSVVLAWLIWRRSPAGWWGLMVLQVVGLANMLTLRGLDVAELYRASGYPEAQVQMMSRMNLLGSPWFAGVMIAAWFGFLFFLLYVRKDFAWARTHTETGAGTSPPPRP